ncbi:D-alanyl-D-alanine carboxypeptidase/D-alanyl-D-alanine-endopeptidase [Nocardioides panacisoli]|uniref:D-alanyl-D-alanine carboxypeptidase/D-alanyl-D-alanine endopeptidase n=1 Tax=Nocardioides panacisoli TaxID=627624 RepID=UPI001C625A58|nr:D-alanyl-D-alanine carboxypeptidase/D-alanyl-D-alanine-endopeptidase [Nocardioides panacisoli]QYJ03717.1 D-alanyl-D-alanine carboxypeptidase/D-alanyl-D-alanine-endopeptidase [Nocardioides panacisoli]
MGRGTTSSRRPLRWIAGFLCVVLVAAGAVAWQLGYAEQWWERWRGEDPAATPAEVEPPPAVEVPDVTTPRSVGRPAIARGTVDVDVVDEILDDYFADPDVGPHALAAVAPLRGDLPGHERVRGGARAVPASTTKVVTSAVALRLLGGDHRFTTRTVLEPGGGAPRVVLVGGGDPYLSAARYRPDRSATFDFGRQSVAKLARRTAAELVERGVTRIRLAHDASLFAGPGGHPTWREDPRLEVGGYLEDGVIAPISALWMDQGAVRNGSGRESDPPAAATQFLAEQLRERGIDVRLVGSATAGADAQDLVALRSAPLSDIVHRLLEVSDNAAAEVLLRHIGLAAEGEGSFAAGERGVRRTLANAGIRMGDSVLHDGSGLSRDSRVTPALLIDVIRWLADPARPELRQVLTSLPVAGFTGSLRDRLSEAPPVGLGRVRAKTGTLTGVSSLAGIVQDRDGRVMAFVLMADRIPEDEDLAARQAQDAAAAALGGCRCG